MISSIYNFQTNYVNVSVNNNYFLQIFNREVMKIFTENLNQRHVKLERHAVFVFDGIHVVKMCWSFSLLDEYVNCLCKVACSEGVPVWHSAIAVIKNHKNNCMYIHVYHLQHLYNSFKRSFTLLFLAFTKLLKVKFI